MDCALSILSSMQLPINNGDNQAVTSDATVVEPDAQTIDVDQQQMVKTLGIVRLRDDGVKFYKPDVSDSVKPLKGKLFNTLEDALHFYKTYAKLSGFEARKSTEYKRKDGKVKQKYFVFSREGFKPIALMDTLVDDFEKLEIKKAKRKQKRPSCRCGCLARVILDITDENKYVVSNNNIGQMKAFKMMKELFGGFDEVGATSVECKNFRRGINLFIGEYDAEMVVELLMNKQEYINGFSCDYFTNDDGNIFGLFWADEVAKHNYLSFGDVISFDATFRSNKYKMVFVPFTGIDNHHHCVTLAAALLSNETAESYDWLLRAFKKAFGREPMVVVTDQDLAMKIAVEKEFCNSRHRFCMWHIMEKLSTKVGPVLSAHSIINDFELQSNNWLSDMFELRFNWIPAYYRDQPMSGLMRTTSWSESENHFFGQLTSTTLTLVEFVSHFDTAMDIQRYTHRTNQHKTRYTTPELLTDYVLEKEAREIYTRTIFYDIQEEICASITDCMSMSLMTIDGTHKFCIKEIGPEVSSLGLFEVLFTPSDVTLSCSCKRFERYVSRRWTRDAVTREKRTVFDGRNKFSDGSIRDEIVKDIIGSVEYCIDKLASNIEELAKGVSKPSKVKIRNPLQSKNKGDRSNSRIIPSKERAMTDGAKKGRKCNHCGELMPDHDFSKLPHIHQ
ncbi:FAR1-related sequence 5-like protein isoform X1 [Tanacetum coccineum]|uniref:FAR1-related sequence 5-like protein isoform X1 n=1 Tax=Tanacetum coccineum TaxID=301880 RepID=A0ABQ5EV36_9ASTR